MSPRLHQSHPRGLRQGGGPRLRPGQALAPRMAPSGRARSRGLGCRSGQVRGWPGCRAGRYASGGLRDLNQWN